MTDVTQTVPAGAPPARRTGPRWRRPVARTTAWCAATAAASHGLLWAGDAFNWNRVYWQPVVGIAIVVVAFTAFGGYFLATERARLAIMATVVLTFVLLLSYDLTLPLGAAGNGSEGAPALAPFVETFQDVVKVVVGFYFGSEAVTTAAKAYAAGQAGDAAGVRTSDVDLPPQNP